MTFVLEELISGDQKNRVDYTEQFKNLTNDIQISKRRTRHLQDNTDDVNADQEPTPIQEIPDL